MGVMSAPLGVVCRDLPCADVDRDGHRAPGVVVDPPQIKVVVISECLPADPANDYYAPGDPLLARTTVQAFRDAGTVVESMGDILDLGVYCTTALKCPKLGASISAASVGVCSHLLEAELAHLPSVKAYLLMGDVAIRALNAIARRSGEPRPVPAGSTYRIRGGDFRYRGASVFPSYLQAGPAFFIEKSKREMIAADIAAALRIVAS